MLSQGLSRQSGHVISRFIKVGHVISRFIKAVGHVI